MSKRSDVKRSWGRDPCHFTGRGWATKTWEKKRVYSCLNCGEVGHFHRSCQNAITSYGVIAVAFGDHLRGSAVEDDCYTCEKHKDAEKLPRIQSENMKITWEGTPLFLLVQRKNSMGFVDLLRGKYAIPSLTYEQQEECLQTHIEELTCEERDLIVHKSFDELWSYLWVNHSSHAFKREYDTAKRIFNERDVPTKVQKSECRYHMTELEVPKGRRQVVEQPIDCAIREFCEETGYSSNDIKLIDIGPVYEEFEGTNNQKYRHVYYFCHMRPGTKMPHLDRKNDLQIGEIRNVGWFSIDDCVKAFRPYNEVKLRVLTNVLSEIVPLIREVVKKRV
jgi:8-oxo-dGTP pyrophosphatase MutT (NUDIX family)